MNSEFQTKKLKFIHRKYLVLLGQKCSFDKRNCNGRFVIQKLAKVSQGSKDVWFFGCSQWKVKLNSKPMWQKSPISPENSCKWSSWIRYHEPNIVHSVNLNYY